jgi:hypothetical protein
VSRIKLTCDSLVCDGSCRASDSVLLACIGGYKWDNNPRDKRPETGLLKVRPFAYCIPYI